MVSFAWCLSFVIGFLSLGEEILWVRVIGFKFETLPPAFSFVLASYLVGIALGAAFGKRLCAKSPDLYSVAAIVLAASALLDVLTPWLIGTVIQSSSELGAPAVAIASTAALKSILFPIAHHLGSSAQGPRVGRSVSRIYFANILGATLGPLAIGFVALDYLSIDECFGLAAAIGLLMSVACVLKSAKPTVFMVTVAAAIAAGAVASKVIHPGPGSLGALAVGRNAMTNFIANRHGVVHTVRTHDGDFVFGGNVYDGIAAVNVDTNANHLDRLYMLALLQADSKRVLFVGMSAGAWVRCALGFRGVEHMDIVEINPAYIELARAYPQLRPLLEDPRVQVHIDDGRRWLRRNPSTRFDAIIQNTSYFWRANADNLLSREYFRELKNHLNPGGIVIMNTTGSFDVLATMQTVFAHTYRYSNFAYAADRDLTPDVARLGEVTRPDGAVFTFGAVQRGSVVALLASARLEAVPDFLARRHADSAIITDDNLLTEYRHGRRFGPQILQKALPPEAPHFEGYDP